MPGLRRPGKRLPAFRLRDGRRPVQGPQNSLAGPVGNNFSVFNDDQPVHQVQQAGPVGDEHQGLVGCDFRQAVPDQPFRALVH
ncbi:MAG: hypothetical protein U0M13_13140, partial [Desulfovibrio fairfieldensis]|nr:hypothetical protein [Desulfovibrio fairfieldensis]